MGTRAHTGPTREEVRAGLLRAARDEFAHAGFHGASLEEIARRAGVGAGEVRGFYPAKEDVFLALLEPEALSLCASLTGLGAPSGDTKADLHRMAVGIQTVVALGTEGNLVFAEFRAHAARDPELARRLADVRRTVVAEIGRWLEDESARLGVRLNAPAEDVVTVVLALVNGLSLEHVGLESPAVGTDAIASVLRGLVRT